MRLETRLLLDYYAGGLLHAILKPPTILLGKILRRSHDLGSCSTISFLKLMGGGSLAIAFPALFSIKGSGRKLRLVTTPAIKPFAEVLGVFDEIIVVRDHSLLLLVWDSLKSFRRLWFCEVLVDLEVHSRLTTVFSLLTCACNRVGFFTGVSFWRRNLSTHLLFFNVCNPVYVFYDQIATLFGCDVKDYESAIGGFIKQLGLEGSQIRGRMALAPCCSELTKLRMLEPEEWLQVLSSHMGSVGTVNELHLLGGPGDRGYLEDLAARIRRRFPGLPVINQAGKLSLRESVLLLSSMECLFCIDSALLHFARLLGVRIVSFWGPTDPKLLLRPLAKERDEIYYERATCSPCVHVADRPPCGGNNICMRMAMASMNKTAELLQPARWQ